MALYASWVHGTAFMPAENPGHGLADFTGIPYTQLLGYRQGHGITFQGKGGGNNWFHVSIPTPVVHNGVRATLLKVFVMFQCGDTTVTTSGQAGANLTEIHIYDGPNQIQKFGTFALFGDHRSRLDTNNTHTLQTPTPMLFGLGISVHINFTKDQKVVFRIGGRGLRYLTSATGKPDGRTSNLPY